MDTVMTFFLNYSFLDIVSVCNLKWRAKFQIYRLLTRDSDWLNFIHFLGYKYKIRLVSILRKRKNQALISISTILKFSALNHLKLYYCNIYISINLIIQSELWILKSALNNKWKYLLWFELVLLWIWKLFKVKDT